jgi:RNA polymerase sigma-70 factor (ECF subfamily)
MTEGCMAITIGRGIQGIKASRNVDGLYSYAMVLTLNAAEADELVEETYLRTLAAMESQPTVNNIRVWQFTTLRNAWLQRSRSGCAGPAVVALSSNTAPKNQWNAQTFCTSKTGNERVREAIEQLPLEYREVILLREYEELSHQEIAAVQGCGVEMVVSRVVKARWQLRTLLFDSAHHGTGTKETK